MILAMLLTTFLTFPVVHAIDCNKTVSRYQKMQCNNAQKLMVSKVDSSKVQTYQPPQFKAGSNNSIDEPTTVPQETSQQYTPGQQYNNNSPSRYTPAPTVPTKPPKKTYFTPY